MDFPALPPVNGFGSSLVAMHSLGPHNCQSLLNYCSSRIRDACHFLVPYLNQFPDNTDAHERWQIGLSNELVGHPSISSAFLYDVSWAYYRSSFPSYWATPPMFTALSSRSLPRAAFIRTSTAEDVASTLIP